ncbi:MAG: M67 family peptidase [Rhodospirillaceae bacterium]|nr:M67 family peptidase [Rhodospirillaceae bacterium]
MTAAPRQIVLPDTCRAQMLVHARETAPHECCGLLIGAGTDVIVIDEIELASNVAEKSERRFEIDPQIQFNVLRRLRGTGRRVVGHYHSHPGGPPGPSATDLAMAHDPEAIWLIVAPAGEGTIAGYICADQKAGFVTVPISARF